MSNANNTPPTGADVMRPYAMPTGGFPKTWGLAGTLSRAEGQSLRAKLCRAASRLIAPVESLVGLDQINGVHWRGVHPQGWNAQGNFMGRALRDINISYHVSDADRARIPKTGPVVVIANHPFGGAEGMILGDLLAQVRPDSRLMANYLLGQIPEWRDRFVLVDPFGGNKAAADNTGPLRQTIRFVRDGGALGVFPAGEVAHFDRDKREVTDPVWSTTVGRIIQMAQATVVPIFFDGSNSRLFQIMGLIHPRLRTALLARELLNKRGTEIELRIGTAIPYRRLASYRDVTELMAYLRQRTFVLRHRTMDEPAPDRKVFQAGGDGASVIPQTSHRPSRIVAVDGEAIVPPVPVEALQREIDALTPRRLLIDGDDYAVFAAEKSDMPNLMQEIGRLREITYRATGEGTGRAIDLDRFDDWYQHLFVWHKPNRQIVGAYRLGMCDRIVKKHGMKGLYTNTLFKYKRPLLSHIGSAIELGRSFIRAEFQRSYQPLLLLWKGIGKLVLTNDQYKILVGPVSISSDYHSVSRQLMVQFLQAQCMAPELTPFARPRNPFRIANVHGFRGDILRQQIKESDDISELVSEIEPDGKGIPVLLRQYLKLGARFFAINVDPDFNDTVDALMIVDLSRTEPKLLERYMGKEHAHVFLARNGAAPAAKRAVKEKELVAV